MSHLYLLFKENSFWIFQLDICNEHTEKKWREKDSQAVFTWLGWAEESFQWIITSFVSMRIWVWITNTHEEDDIYTSVT